MRREDEADEKMVLRAGEMIKRTAREADDRAKRWVECQRGRRKEKRQVEIMPLA